MLFVSPEDVQKILDYPALIAQLEKAFAADYQVPLRHHHDYDNPVAQASSTLLLMPAWQVGHQLGVKIVTISPENSKYDLPAIFGTYMLFDAQKGMPLLQTDARLLTCRRTAAASALASQFLSNPQSETLLMVGTGAMAPHLIEAHCSNRPIKKVMIWGRSIEKAQKVVNQLSHLQSIQFSLVEQLDQACSTADIISCATLSPSPLIKGNWLRAGQHIDLVGSYKPDMREADDQVIQRAQVYVDTLEGACKESGDIVIPIEKGLLKKEEIRGDLFGLCRQEVLGRTDTQSITLFKSVGHALEDLAAAQLLYHNLVK